MKKNAKFLLLQWLSLTYHMICEHYTETLQVVHATTTGSRIPAFKFCATPWLKSMCADLSTFSVNFSLAFKDC